MLRAIMIGLVILGASRADAEVILACTFPTLPATVMRFPEGVEKQKTMIVGERPEVPLTEGQGAGRLISASVDGYDFRFAPANSVMDVSKDKSLVASETGNCVTIGGPVNDMPLQIAGNEPIKPAPAESDVRDQGAWIVSQDKSAFDDSTTVVLMQDSTDPIRGQFGAPGPAQIYIRCQENTTALFLVLNDLFLSDIQGFGTVDYRVDDQPADSARMGSSTDNKALGLWNGATSIPMIKELMKGTQVVFRATPFNDSPVEFSFELSGLETAVAPLREACSW